MMRTRAVAERIVIVSGSSRGIGRETARYLLNRGASVVINGRSCERLEKTKEELLRDTGCDSRSLIAVCADLSDPAGGKRLIDETIDRYGRVDALVNNVGVSMRGSIRDLRAPAIRALIDGTLVAAAYPTIAALPHLLSERGTVVFVSTAAALWGFPGVSWYSATKAGLRSFAQALDAEHRRDGLSVTTVFLDFVENDPDKETVAADGTPFVHSRRARLTQAAAAEAIVAALCRPRLERVVSAPGRALKLATRFAPRALSWYLSRSGGATHRVDRRD